MNGLKGAVLTIKPSGSRWRINEAVSMNEARDAIYEAAATGSLGYVSTVSDVGGPEKVLADVERVS